MKNIFHKFIAVLIVLFSVVDANTPMFIIGAAVYIETLLKEQGASDE